LAASGFFSNDDLLSLDDGPFLALIEHASQLGLVLAGARMVPAPAQWPEPAGPAFRDLSPPAPRSTGSNAPLGVLVDERGRAVVVPAHAGPRLLAYLIDIPFAAIPSMIGVPLIAGGLAVLPGNRVSTTTSILVFVALTLLGMSYEVGCHASRRGQTIGKWVMGIRVADADTGRPITVSVALWRAVCLRLVMFAVTLAALLPLLMIGAVLGRVSLLVLPLLMVAGAFRLLGGKGQSAWDRSSGTSVIRVR
jgi:uncharacterized RDD family membrane protein YckC